MKAAHSLQRKSQGINSSVRVRAAINVDMLAAVGPLAPNDFDLAVQGPK